MSSATHLPRCPHRVETTRPSNWLTVLLVTLLGSTTATVSLNGQEVDIRIVDPAGHVQPWPVSEPEILITPSETMRIANMWRTNLGLNAEDKEKPTVEASKLPDPVIEEPESSAEVVIVPQTIEDSRLALRALPPTSPSTPQPIVCYQAPPLSAMSVSIALPGGDLPTDVAAHCALQTPPTGDARMAGAWGGTDFNWSATCMRHRPLYFEEINAERYGYTVSYTFQPIISAARFFATIPALPYKMVIERPRDCIYTLGHYRPGSCAPRRWNRLPWKLTAGAVETGFIAAMILIIP